jgi:hypothetical protein
VVGVNERKSTAHVLFGRDCFEMIWIHTSAVATEVIDLHTLRDLPDPVRVRDAVSEEEVVS